MREGEAGPGWFNTKGSPRWPPIHGKTVTVSWPTKANEGSGQRTTRAQQPPKSSRAGVYKRRFERRLSLQQQQSRIFDSSLRDLRGLGSQRTHGSERMYRFRIRYSALQLGEPGRAKLDKWSHGGWNGVRKRNGKIIRRLLSMRVNPCNIMSKATEGDTIRRVAGCVRAPSGYTF